MKTKLSLYRARKRSNDRSRGRPKKWRRLSRILNETDRVCDIESPNSSDIGAYDIADYDNSDEYDLKSIDDENSVVDPEIESHNSSNHPVSSSIDESTISCDSGSKAPHMSGESSSDEQNHESENDDQFMNSQYIQDCIKRLTNIQLVTNLVKKLVQIGLSTRFHESG